MRKKVVFLGILLLLPVALFLFFPIDYGLRVKCLRVIDGDTIIVSSFMQETRVRLLHIDAPEISQLKVGEASKAFLKKLIEGKEVRLYERKKDLYGRTLAKIKLGDLDVNLEMIREGMAVIYRYARFKNKKEKVLYLTTESKSKLSQIGIFKTSFLEPYLYRKKKGRPKSLP